VGWGTRFSVYILLWGGAHGLVYIYSCGVGHTA